MEVSRHPRPVSMRKPEVQASQEWEWSALPVHVSLGGGALLGSHPAVTSYELQMGKDLYLIFPNISCHTGIQPFSAVGWCILKLRLGEIREGSFLLFVDRIFNRGCYEPSHTWPTHFLSLE